MGVADAPHGIGKHLRQTTKFCVVLWDALRVAQWRDRVPCAQGMGAGVGLSHLWV